jgi:RNA binding exosome subunit
LSSRVALAYIDIRAFVHATEDMDNVLSAVCNIIPAELSDKIVFRKTNLKGHYGNPIVLLETRVKKRREVEAIFEKLASDLSILDKEILSGEIRQRLSKGNLFIRLDKQSACLNEVKLRSDDPIHLRLHFKKSSLDEIMKACRRSGMLL